MIGRILRLEPEDQPAPAPPRRKLWKWLLLAIALMMLFAATVMVMMRLLPGPHGQSDYLIAGALATMFTMLVLFAVLLSTAMKARDAFYKRRPK
jgi:drug/metabolite transporter (DMT)-like permease